ncbi:hypothetical protein BB560_006661 [Smittium megazygosporum]|uniref:BD-FAE-like domain-containing protein n=1 Tax=Smittium megazygosporum TaxID=133381 RepID=A0A2T9Y2K8_9FUNG|nr:hypothetical protein BB560_006661 [Smittium megazygosporum]
MRPGPSGIKDVKYIPTSTDPKHTLDLYLPSSDPNEPLPPLVIFIHGGWWRANDKSKYAALGLGLSQLSDNQQNRKCAVAITNYRLTVKGSDKIKHPDHYLDSVQAIQFLYQSGSKYGYDSSKISIIGTSCGGHIAGLIALDPPASWWSPIENLTRENYKHVTDTSQNKNTESRLDRDILNITGYPVESSPIPPLGTSRCLAESIKNVVYIAGAFDLNWLAEKYPSYEEFFIMPFGLDKSFWSSTSPQNAPFNTKDQEKTKHIFPPGFEAHGKPLIHTDQLVLLSTGDELFTSETCDSFAAHLKSLGINTSVCTNIDFGSHSSQLENPKLYEYIHNFIFSHT